MNIIELHAMAPILVLGAGALFLLMLSVAGKRLAPLAPWAALAVIVVSGIALLAKPSQQVVFDGLVRFDGFSRLLSVFILAATAASIQPAYLYLKKINKNSGEFYALLLFAALGATLMVSAHDFVVLFLSLEVLSLSLYILAGWNKESDRSTEAALKYFITGAFASAILLAGIALYYGALGSTSFEAIKTGSAFIPGLIPAALAALLCGLAFKIALFPFHAWAPDVYEGAPSPAAGFMSTTVKIAAASVILRLAVTVFSQSTFNWMHILAGLSVASMTIGNLAALRQDNVKRMAAYSGIAHAGYVMAGISVAANAPGAASAVLFYIAAYAAMNIGLFAAIAAVEKPGEKGLTFDDYRGIGFRFPWFAIPLAAILFSLAGIPPFAGFFGKYAVFASAVDQGYVWLAVVGVLNSLVSVYFYLRLVVNMYMRESDENGQAKTMEIPIASTLMVALSALFVLWLGVAPFGLSRLFPSADGWWAYTAHAAFSLFPGLK